YSVSRGATPMNEKRPMRSPPSADSRRNAPPSARSFANAETGVSRSARRSRITGTSFVVRCVVTAIRSPFARNERPSLPTSGRGSWCHPNLPTSEHSVPRVGLSLHLHGAPVGNGGLPGRRADSRVLPRVLRDPFAPAPSHSDPLEAADPTGGQDPGDPARAAHGDRIPRHREGAARPHGAAPPGVHLLGRARDRHPGP